MIVYTGTVKATAGLFVRSTPNGTVVGKLNYGDAIQGQGELALAGSYHWMQISSPIVGWIASEFVAYDVQNVEDQETPAQKIYVSYTQGGTEYEYLLGG